MGKTLKKVASLAIPIAITALTGGAGAASFLGLAGIPAIVARAAVSFVVSGLTSSLSKPSTSTPKVRKPAAQSFALEATSRTLAFRQPITSRKIIYGEVRVSGPLINAGSSESNKYLHMIIPLAGHECAGIDEVWLDDDVIPNDALDANGMVTSGKYAGKVRIKKYLGGDGQNADTATVAELPGWTVNHRGQGICYMIVRFENDRTLFPNGVPNPSAIVRGKNIYDSRAAAAAWTPNAALMAYDYLTDEKYGIETVASDIGAAETESAANSCEEIVDTQNADMAISSVAAGTDIITLSGDLLIFQRADRVRLITGGTPPAGLATGTDYYVIPYQFRGTPRVKLATSLDNAVAGVAIDITDAGSGSFTLRKTGEPRYFGGGVIDTAAPLGENLRDILSGMAGKAPNTGGFWKIFAGVYTAPTVTLNEKDHLRAPVTITPRGPMEEKFNSVKGIYVSPVNNWQPADYPMITNPTHVTADMGIQKIADFDLPLTQRATTAQRIATIFLNKHRQEIRLPFPANLHGLQFQAGSTLELDYARMGWEGKAFEVDSWKLNIDIANGVPIIGADMMLSETASGVYSWSSDDELLVDPAPNTNLPNAFDVDPPNGLFIDSIPLGTLEGDEIYRVVASWNAVENAFVSERGLIEIEYKKSEDSTWLQIPPVPGYATRADVFSGELGTQYDIRIRSVNSRGIASAWNTLSGFTVGTQGGISATYDYGNWTESLGDALDYGNWTESLGATLDYGGFTG